MSTELMRVNENVTIIKINPKRSDNNSMSKENAKWTSKIRIEKYNNDSSYNLGIPDEVKEVTGNTAFIVGINALWKIATGDSSVYPLNASNTFIGVGDSSASATPDQTGLLGINKAYAPMDNTSGIFPLIANNTLTVRARFGSTDANFTWNEWGVLNGNPLSLGDREAQSVIQFNRKVETMGTKIEGSIWVIIADITINP